MTQGKSLPTARLRLVSAVASIIAVAGFWSRTIEQTPAPIGVVIITLDTTRADRLPVYGFMGVSMPHLERLAREGVVFDRASSVAPLTLPAHTSLFTGLFPPAHGVRENADPPLAPDHTTLAESLNARGFRTAAFVGSVVLSADRGLSQGFDHYQGVVSTDSPGRSPGPPRRRRADVVVSDAIRWIDSLEASPFFVWAHLYDPHRPYGAPEPFASRYSDPYIAELAFVDAQIGRVLEALERRRLLDRTIVVVTADHGESLGEHGERDHGIFVYESVVRIPLIVRAPGVPPRRVGDVVRLVDVMPTVMDLLNVSHGPMDGVSAAGLLHGRSADRELEAYAESRYPARFGWSPVRAIRGGRYKLIDSPRPELYDLERDPYELRNIYDDRPQLTRALAERLTSFDRGNSMGPSQPVSDPTPPGELRGRLASLGYIGSGASTTAFADRSLPDAKDCIARVALQPRPRACGRTDERSWPEPIGQLFVDAHGRPAK